MFGESLNTEHRSRLQPVAQRHRQVAPDQRRRAGYARHAFHERLQAIAPLDRQIALDQRAGQFTATDVKRVDAFATQ